MANLVVVEELVVEVAVRQPERLRRHLQFRFWVTNKTVIPDIRQSSPDVGLGCHL
jgi:hypothetical protein